MKFSDGYWMMREGVQAFHPVEVLDVDAGADSFTVYAPVERIRHRGDLLKGPVVTVTCESPMPDVIGVTLTHFAGERRRGPDFELATDPGGEVSVDEEAATLTSGALSVRVGRGEEWCVDFFADGRR
ncbi:alpha-xylosidase, partial [Micromonospora aurantiaca]|nr:alpha-xylosidase [Micromonospora aurantiaca]